MVIFVKFPCHVNGETFFLLERIPRVHSQPEGTPQKKNHNKWWVREVLMVTILVIVFNC